VCDYGLVTKTALKNKLWKQIAIYIKNRDGHICQLCGKKCYKSDCHCSHILPKSSIAYPGYEFEEWNLKCLCSTDHLRFWHKNPLEAAIKFQEMYPDRYRMVLEKAKAYKAEKKSYSVADLMEKYQHYLKLNS